jgi:hypothetical protein
MFDPPQDVRASGDDGQHVAETGVPQPNHLVVANHSGLRRAIALKSYEFQWNSKASNCGIRYLIITK